MKFLFSLVASISFLFAGLTSYADSGVRCPSKESDAVQFESASVIYDQLASLALVKDEFETTASFEERRNTALREAGIGALKLVGAVYDPEQVTYDADSQMLILKTYAWDNIGVSWRDVFGYDNSYGIEPDVMENFGVGVYQEEVVLGSYEASNAYGAKTVVSKITRKTYGVFDGPNEKRTDEWVTELTVGEYNSPAISVSVNLDQARALKNSLRVGIWIRPKAPFSASGMRRIDPKINRPREINTTTNVIVADVLCAVVADSNGNVLKTISSAR